MAPGANRIFREPAPNRGLPDRSHDPALDGFAADLGETESRERETQSIRHLASERLDLDNSLRGKNEPAVQLVILLPGRPSAVRKIVCATC